MMEPSLVVAMVGVVAWVVVVLAAEAAALVAAARLGGGEINAENSTTFAHARLVE